MLTTLKKKEIRENFSFSVASRVLTNFGRRKANESEREKKIKRPTVTIDVIEILPFIHSLLSRRYLFFCINHSSREKTLTLRTEKRNGDQQKTTNSRRSNSAYSFLWFSFIEHSFPLPSSWTDCNDQRARQCSEYIFPCHRGHYSYLDRIGHLCNMVCLLGNVFILHDPIFRLLLGSILR